MLLKDMRENSLYSFTTYNPTILGATHSKMLFVGRGLLEVVSGTDKSLASKHLAVHASLPPGVTRDATKLNYLMFRTASNQLQVFAYDWLVAETIVMTGSQKLTVTIDLTDPGQESKFLAYIAEGGYRVRESSLG